MTSPQQPSVAVMGLTKSELITLCDQYRAKAQQAHDDARAARNQVVILTARIAVLRNAYEPEGMEPPC